MHLSSSQVLKVNFAGGDKPAEDCKDPTSKDMTSFKDAMTDLVKAVSIVHFLGKDVQEFIDEE